MTSKLYKLLSLLVLSLLLRCVLLAQSTGGNSGQNQQQPGTEGNNTGQSQQQPSSGNPPNAQTGNAPGQDQTQQKETDKKPDQNAEKKPEQNAEKKPEPNDDQDTNGPAGTETGGYLIHQSIEIGYRGSDVTGSQAMYNTLVDLPSGPRLLEQTLSMQSPAHAGFLFDNLFVNSFGWGGDPNNAFNARLDKGKLYDFRAMFRADHSDFNYDLLANPLNPPTSNPNIPVTSSPHAFATRRRMYDYDLTLFPQSTVTFHMGYSRNNMTGPSFSSVHEGTDALLDQLWNTTLNSYRFGADFKILPRTVISYDQTLDYYKGDTSWQLAPFAPAFVPGIPGNVELGLPIDTGNKNPCAATPSTASLIDATGSLTNLGCNAFFNYTRADHIRTSTPTERISLHSNYFSRLELNASYAYSNADMTAPVNEFFNGLSSRGRTRQTTVVGPGDANQISNVADFTATGHISQHFRVVETFRFWAYRIPSAFTSVETDFNVPGSGSCTPPSCSLLTPISATTPNLTDTADQLSFNQNWWRNQVDLVWDASKHFGGRIGFRYGDRVFHRFLNFTGDEDRTVIHEYTPLIAVWARPMHSLRLNFDWENTSSSDTIVRIAPRKESRYRAQINYTPQAWLVVGGSINLWQASNNDAFTNYRGHNRNYGFTATVTKWKRFGFDFAYNYSNYLQASFVCFNSSDTTNPVVAGAGSCTANGFDDADNNLLIDGRYTNNTHYAMGLVTVKPEPRLTLQAGYSINSVDGQAPLLNSLQPFGPLQYNYHQPLANIALDLGHNITGKAAWNYYQYGEKSFVGPTDPRYFHANNATVSLRWAF